MTKKGKDSKKAKKEAPVQGSVSSALTMAARSMRTALSKNLLECGLYAGQDGVILALAESDGLTPGALAQHLGVKAPTMTRTIARLQAQGFLIRQDGEDDGRTVRIRLSPAGLQSVEKIGQCIANAELEATEGLDAKEIRQLVKLLRKLDNNLVTVKDR